jgi:hypothetical protein
MRELWKTSILGHQGPLALSLLSASLGQPGSASFAEQQEATMWFLLEVAVAVVMAFVLLAVLVSAMTVVVSPRKFIGWRQKRRGRLFAEKHSVAS